MKYRYLGKSGLQVSALGLGTNSFGSRADEAASIRIIHQALELGINFIDTANIYTGTESERIIGEAIKDRRHEVVLATKAGLVRDKGPNGQGSSRFHIMREIEGSLRRLKTDYIDLYQIHTFDPNTPLEETLRALDDLVRSGKVRYIGASNYAAWELMKALGISERMGLSGYVSIQPSYSLADRTPEQELIPLCLDQGIGVIPYYPLAGGILTGKYGDGKQVPEGSRVHKEPSSYISSMLNDNYMQLSQQVAQIANELGTTSSALSLAWLMASPAVSTIIVGASSAEQVVKNAESVSLHLSPETMEALDRISLPFRYGQPFASYRLSAE